MAFHFSRSKDLFRLIVPAIIIHLNGAHTGISTGAPSAIVQFQAIRRLLFKNQQKNVYFSICQL